MGIYDRDYCRTKKEKKKLKHLIFKVTWWLIVLLFVAAFAVYVLAILSEK